MKGEHLPLRRYKSAERHMETGNWRPPRTVILGRESWPYAIKGLNMPWEEQMQPVSGTEEAWNENQCLGTPEETQLVSWVPGTEENQQVWDENPCPGTPEETQTWNENTWPTTPLKTKPWSDRGTEEKQQA